MPENPSAVSSVVHEMYGVLENKVNSLSVILEKFDLQALAENLGHLGNKLEVTSNTMAAGVKSIHQLKQEHSVMQPTCNHADQHFQVELTQLKQDLDFTKAELVASRNSNELLMSTVKERDEMLTAIREWYERTILKHVDKDNKIAVLESANKQLEEIAVNAEEVDELKRQFEEVRAANDTYAAVNSRLSTQAAEATELIKSLTDSLSRLSQQRSLVEEEGGTIAANTAFTKNVTDSDEDEEREEVIILHDSLCGKINNTILSRENVSVRKIWAPDTEKMEEELEHVNSKVVVLEAWTRDLDSHDVDEMTARITNLVDKALTKAEKVVISNIIHREDIDDIDLKTNSINAFIDLKYRVVILGSNIAPIGTLTSQWTLDSGMTS